MADENEMPVVVGGMGEAWYTPIYRSRTPRPENVSVCVGRVTHEYHTFTVTAVCSVWVGCIVSSTQQTEANRGRPGGWQCRLSEGWQSTLPKQFQSVLHHRGLLIGFPRRLKLAPFARFRPSSVPALLPFYRIQKRQAFGKCSPANEKI